MLFHAIMVFHFVASAFGHISFFGHQIVSGIKHTLDSGVGNPIASGVGNPI